MDNNFNSFNPVSGADSASVQEQLVKGSLSSSNFNIVDEFCCTYHKYNEGRPLAGMWLDLYTFSCYEDFVAACRWLHRDEQDPEFAYLDYENYPDEWYSESGLDEATFERILEYADLDDDEQEAFRAFLDVTSDSDADFSDFRERYCGRWDSEEEFAQHLADELCMFDNVPESITRFFDFKAFARELFPSGGFSCAHAERDPGRPQQSDPGDERKKPGPPTNPKKNRIPEGFCLLSAVFIAIIL